jgi:hypothetical protein
MSAEEIYAAYGLTCPPRVGTLRDPTRPTYGRAVARIAARLGTPMMPWQRYAADVALEFDQAARALVYRNVRMLTPRQSGKTTEILAVTTHRMTEMGRQARKYAPAQGTRQTSLYAAQKRLNARRKFVEEHIPKLEASPFRSMFRQRLTNGDEALRWDGGGLQGITASGETSAHGETLDLGVEDEAFAAEDARLEQAFSPAMITRWSPQHWVISTEGTEKSLYLAAIVDQGREMVEAGEQTSVCYLEWSDLDGDRADPETWLRCMPALCPIPGPAPCTCDPAGVWRHTVRLETIRAELQKMSKDPSEFDRAYLNRRRRKVPPPDPNIPPVEEWNACVDVRSRPGEPVAFAIDVTPARSHAAIVVCGPCDAGWHWEVIDHRPGLDWVVPRALELAERWDPVAWGLDVAGPAGSLAVPLADATRPELKLKIPHLVRPASEDKAKRGQLWVPTARDVTAACGAVADAIRAGRLRHMGQRPLMDAYAAARTRPLGDAWAWARRTAEGDISPLVGGTVAAGAYEARKHLGEDYDVLASLGLDGEGDDR